MGGFEGGDEGGFWDIDILPTSTHKQNSTTPTKSNRERSYIETTETGYSIKAHVKGLYDTISFVSCKCETFTIEGCDDIPFESNTIYKAFLALNDFTNDPDITDFFYEHKVVVTKRIPLSSGLGGSSSDAAAFMFLTKEACNLVLSMDELIRIGSTIAPTVPSFLTEYS